MNYSGNNLIGMAFQGGKQAVFSGGSLVNSMNDKKIETSFSKKEANSALERMKSDDATMPDGKKMSANDKRDKFIQAVESGNIHVNKGQIENAITVVKAPVKAILAPIPTAIKVSKAAWSVAEKSLSTMVIKPARSLGIAPDKLRNEVIKNLEDTGKITTNQKSLPEGLKYLARTDEEKLIIKKAVREKSMQEEVSLPKATSMSVIKDLKTKNNYIENTEEFTGAKFSNNNKSPTAMAIRAKERVGNLFERGESRIEKSKRVAEMHQQNLVNLNKDIDKRIEPLRGERDSLILNDKEIKTKEGYEKFAILEKARNSIVDKGNRTASISDDVQKEMRANGMGDIVDKLNKPFLGIKTSSKNQLTKYLDKLIEKEVSKNPELFENIRENRFRVKEINLELVEADKKKEKIENLSTTTNQGGNNA